MCTIMQVVSRLLKEICSDVQNLEIFKLAEFFPLSSESSNRAGLSKLSTITVCTTTYSYYYYTYYTYSSYYHSSTSHSYSGIKSYQKCTTQYTTSSSSCSYAQDTYASVVCSNRK